MRMGSVILVFWIAAWATPRAANGQSDHRRLIDTLEDIAQGGSKKAKVTVAVTDCETKKPVCGAAVELRYHKDVSAGHVTVGECSGEAAGATDEKGNVTLRLTVKGCPRAFIGVKERLYIRVYARGYEQRGAEIEGSRASICLEKAAWESVSPPIKIDYPEYAIDLPRFKNIFDRINKMNRRNIGEKVEEKSSVVRRYAYALDGQDFFLDFLLKIAFVSDIKSVPLLRQIVTNQYPLPYKRIKFTDSESWRAPEDMYDLGRLAVARALLNIADDRVNDLLPAAVDIPSPYLNVLKDAGISLTADDFWDYLFGKYPSRAGLLLPTEGRQTSDPLVFVQSMLKERLSKEEYERQLTSFYFLLHKLYQEKYGDFPDTWMSARDRVGAELIQLKTPYFGRELKKIIPDMDVNDLTRKYLVHLYEMGEHAFLVQSLRENKKLMRAFLGLDRGDKRDDPPRYYYSEKDKKSLIAKMPKVTAALKDEIGHFMRKESKRSPLLASWLIENLATIDRKAAASRAVDLYSAAQDTSAKERVLTAAEAAHINSLCEPVYDELDLANELRGDYFALGYRRIKYLSAACPQHMARFVDTFDFHTVNEKKKNKSFETHYGPSGQTLFAAVMEFFPRERAVELARQYFCRNIELIRSIYDGRSTELPRYPVKCLCELFERQLPLLERKSASRVVDYLNSCYPELKEKHELFRQVAPGGDAVERTYKSFYEITGKPQEDERYYSPTPVYDEGFRSFFFGKGTGPQGTQAEGAQVQALDRRTAFSLFEQAFNSPDEHVRQSALYAFAWFPEERPAALVEVARRYAESDLFPDYLYAAYSLAAADPSGPLLRSCCERAARYHLTAIDKRSYVPDRQAFAFTAVLTLDLCRIAGDGKHYAKLLDALMRTDRVGRYKGFQRDLETIISSSPTDIGGIIERLLESRRPVEIIVGLRLAEIKNHLVKAERLKGLLEHDDSYVRRAAAAQVILHRQVFPELFTSLKDNTNRAVRLLQSSVKTERETIRGKK